MSMLKSSQPMQRLEDDLAAGGIVKGDMGVALLLFSTYCYASCARSFIAQSY